MMKLHNHIVIGGLALMLSSSMIEAEAQNINTDTITHQEQPRINGASVYGCRPGHPFLYLVPATGGPKLTFSAQGLPEGLSIDSQTGIISGQTQARGEYAVKLGAENSTGKTEKNFKLVVGDRIGLTPPMGWNSWNCWGIEVSQDKIIRAARAMKNSGLSQHGWNYINIDDGWQGKRGGKFNAIQPNSKFTDMKELSNEVHAMGLKLGIYASPWMETFGGHIGCSSDSQEGTYEWITTNTCDKNFRADQRNRFRRFGNYSFIKQDVKQWNEWGIDYLKYDWHPIDVPHVRIISEILNTNERDIFLSLSYGATLEYAPDYAALANSWRTTGDIVDTWESITKIAGKQEPWCKWNGPGHWNDPDMLVLGVLGWGENVKPSRLTHDEQYFHFSLWCMLAAPLLLGCDLERLDAFTYGLITNDEVIAIDQDEAGIPAFRVPTSNEHHVIWARTLADNSMAVGLFNLGETPAKISINWQDLKINGSAKVRNLWQHKDCGAYTTAFSADVPAHGVVMVKITPEQH